MSTPTSPFAMVQPGSDAQRGLLALGWSTTDIQAGWDHMEPPAGAPVLVRRSHEDFEPPYVEQEPESRITLRELKKGSLDMLAVTAEDLNGEEIEELRRQIDMAMSDPDYTIVANFDIVFTLIKFPDEGGGQLYKHLDPVSVTQVDDGHVTGEVDGSYTARWSADRFYDGLPAVGDRLILSTSLVRPRE